MDGYDCRGSSGETAGKGCVVVDVEFEKVVEGIGHGDGAVLIHIVAVAEFEGRFGFRAGREGDILQLVV